MTGDPSAAEKTLVYSALCTAEVKRSHYLVGELQLIAPSPLGITLFFFLPRWWNLTWVEVKKVDSSRAALIILQWKKLVVGGLKEA